MKFDPFYGSVPLVGVELEVQSWLNSKQNTSYLKIYEAINKLDTFPQVFAQAKHEWRCKCPVCVTIGSQIIAPVQWKAQHDGSLPHEGVEYISSIFPTIPQFVNSAMSSIIEMLKWNDWKHNVLDTHNQPSYPSFHVHCSLDKQSVPKYYYSMSMMEEVQRCMVEYYPELIALASACGYIRPNIHFRTPRWMTPDDGKQHHIFIAPAQEHFEWRIWEAPPGTKFAWYYEAAIYTSASLTQALLDYNVLRALEGVALTNPGPGTSIDKFVEAKQYLPYVDKKRFRALEIAATECSTIVANPEAIASVQLLFNKARKEYL